MNIEKVNQGKEQRERWQVAHRRERSRMYLPSKSYKSSQEPSLFKKAATIRLMRGAMLQSPITLLLRTTQFPTNVEKYGKMVKWPKGAAKWCQFNLMYSYWEGNQLFKERTLVKTWDEHRNSAAFLSLEFPLLCSSAAGFSPLLCLGGPLAAPCLSSEHEFFSLCKEKQLTPFKWNV